MSSNVSLKQVIRNIQANYEVKISSATELLEQDYFNNPSNLVPMRFILSSASFDQQIENLSSFAKKADIEELEKIYRLVSNFFLFSVGFDFVFKSKLQADMYTSCLVGSIYKMMEDAITSKYNDLSVVPQNPNYSKNLKGIENTIITYYDVQALLNTLYCNDFQFPENWKDSCHNGTDAALKILQESNMTIGEYLNGLLDFKISILTGIFSKIDNVQARNDYLAKIQVLKDEKKGEIASYEYSNLPIAYFYDHTLEEYMREKVKSNSSYKFFKSAF